MAGGRTLSIVDDPSQLIVNEPESLTALCCLAANISAALAVPRTVRSSALRIGHFMSVVPFVLRFVLSSLVIRSIRVMCSYGTLSTISANFVYRRRCPSALATLTGRGHG